MSGFQAFAGPSCSGVLGFWGFGVLGFWGFGVLGFWSGGAGGFGGVGVAGVGGLWKMQIDGGFERDGQIAGRVLVTLAPDTLLVATH